MTGRIFLKLLLGLFCLLLLALVAVDYFATRVAKDTYIRNLVEQRADNARVLALALPGSAPLDGEKVREMARASGGRLTVVPQTLDLRLRTSDFGHYGKSKSPF